MVLPSTCAASSPSATLTNRGSTKGVGRILARLPYAVPNDTPHTEVLQPAHHSCRVGTYSPPQEPPLPRPKTRHHTRATPLSAATLDTASQGNNHARKQKMKKKAPTRPGRRPALSSVRTQRAPLAGVSRQWRQHPPPSRWRQPPRRRWQPKRVQAVLLSVRKEKVAAVICAASSANSGSHGRPVGAAPVGGCASHWRWRRMAIGGVSSSDPPLPGSVTTTAAAAATAAADVITSAIALAGAATAAGRLDRRLPEATQAKQQLPNLHCAPRGPTVRSGSLHRSGAYRVPGGASPACQRPRLHRQCWRRRLPSKV